jgi:UDP-4-amino-4,6-dideoxy-N-acetyl-beta-L-altrosamine N-acetyltransferase
VELRPLTIEDAALVLAWRNRPDVARFMGDDRPIAPPDHERWMVRILASPAHRYWIVEHGGRPVGSVNLADIDRQHGHCSWGFYVGDPTACEGGSADRFHMSDALFRVAEVAFIELRLQKLCAQVLASNDRSLALHERMGFVREGVLREHIRHADGMHDLVVLGLLREEWEALR